MKYLASLVRSAPLFLLMSAPSFGFEGMWEYLSLPKEKLEQIYGFTLTDSFLKAVSTATVKLSSGCSGSFVSPNGLVMTNLHCVDEDFSAQQKDHDPNKAFYSGTQEGEIKISGMTIDQFLSAEDITDEVKKRLEHKPYYAYEFIKKESPKTVLQQMEKECAEKNGHVCRISVSFSGNQFSLYHYKHYTDVRAVFVPEAAAGFFGGDPDNFEFPRYALDASFVRVYENGVPVHTEYLRPAKSDLKTGDLVMVMGNPGSTQRNLTAADLSYERAEANPLKLRYQAAQEAGIANFISKHPETANDLRAELNMVANFRKADNGEAIALRDEALFSEKQAREQALKNRSPYNRNRKLQLRALRKIAKVREFLTKDHSTMTFNYITKRLFFSDLARRAYSLGRDLESRPPLNPENFAQPLNIELDQCKFSAALRALYDDLACDPTFQAEIFQGNNPEALAESLVSGTFLTKFSEIAEILKAPREELAKDPMVSFVGRMLEKLWATDSKEKRLATRVNRAYETVLANPTLRKAYPDGALTARITFGEVKTYNDPRYPGMADHTTIEGAFQHEQAHHSEEPYRLPPTWKQAEKQLNPNTHLNFVSTTDIHGGNSGSAVINRNGEVVGLAFDSNSFGIGSRYTFKEDSFRTVSVDVRGIKELLSQAYGARKLVAEMELQKAEQLP